MSAASVGPVSSDETTTDPGRDRGQDLDPRRAPGTDPDPAASTDASTDASADASSGTGPVFTELLRLRASIDNMDAALIHLLAERFKITQQVGELKAAHQLPPADPARERQQIARLRALADDARLDPEFAEKFLNFVVAEVVRHHEAIAERR